MNHGSQGTGFLLAHFDDRYWVLFSIVKSMFFFLFQSENSQFKEQKKLSPYFDILTALCHSKCNFAFKILKWYLLVNQMFALFFFFDYILWCELFPILYKTPQKISNSGGQVIFPKWGEKTLRHWGDFPAYLGLVLFSRTFQASPPFPNTFPALANPALLQSGTKSIFRM